MSVWRFRSPYSKDLLLSEQRYQLFFGWSNNTKEKHTFEHQVRLFSSCDITSKRWYLATKRDHRFADLGGRPQSAYQKIKVLENQLYTKASKSPSLFLFRSHQKKNLLFRCNYFRDLRPNPTHLKMYTIPCRSLKLNYFWGIDTIDHFASSEKIIFSLSESKKSKKMNAGLSRLCRY